MNNYMGFTLFSFEEKVFQISESGRNQCLVLIKFEKHFAESETLICFDIAKHSLTSSLNVTIYIILSSASET